MTDVDLLYIDDYPELKQLCWNFNSETVSKRKAFSLYIDRWGHLEEENLLPQERMLIEELTTIYGKGHFFPRAHGRGDIDAAFSSVTVPEHEINPDHLLGFNSFIVDSSYPGMRNGIHYYWKSDYEEYLINIGETGS